VNQLFKPVIVGAGVIGNYLAWKLSSNDRPPIVLDKKEKVGVPVQCSGLVSPRIKELIKPPSSIIVNEIKGAVLHFPNETMIQIKSRENALVLDRQKLDEHFYELALANNTKYYLGNELMKYVISDKVFGRTNKLRFTTEVLVGADGPQSMIARKQGISTEYCVGVQATCEYANEDKNFVHLFFGKKYSPMPFAWIIPENEEKSRIGMFTPLNQEHKKRLLDEFIHYLDAKPLTYQAGLIPMGFNTRYAFERVVVVGDAANHTKPSTGGGIVTGMIAANTLCTALLKAYEEEDFSQEFFIREYEDKVNELLLKQLRLSYKSRVLMNSLKDSSWNYISDFLRTSSIKKVIEEYGDMDFFQKLFNKLFESNEFKKFAVKLIIKQPTLLTTWLTT